MTKTSRLICWILILCSLATRWKLFEKLPPTWGYDAYSHIDYLALAYRNIFPEIGQIWQGYQSPAYYFLSAWLAKAVGTDPFRTAQAVSLLSSILVVVPGYLLARRLVPGWEPLVGLALLTLPSSLLTSTMVYNQQMATVWVGVFLLLLQQAWNRPPTLLRDAALGVAFGAAVMTKFDGLMLGLPVVLLWLHRLRRSPGQAASATLALSLTNTVAVAMFAVLLLRNTAGFGEPFITSRHPLLYPYPLFETLHLPNFLHLRSLVDPGIALWLNPLSKNVESLPMFLFTNLWGGDYTNAWRGPLQTPVPGQLPMLAGVALTAIMALGFYQIKSKPQWHPTLAVALANLILLGLFFCKQPDYTNYKACYFHAIYYLLALSLAAGARELYCRGYHRASIAAWAIPQAILVASFW